MIEYEEERFSDLIFRIKGSVAPRAAAKALPGAVFALIFVCADVWLWPGLREDYGLMETTASQLWSGTTAVLAVLLGMRTNRAIARFWEGTGLLHQMRGEWFDSVSCCVAFSRASLAARPVEVQNFRHTLVRLMSLAHRSSLEEISGDDIGLLETIDTLGLDDATLKHLKRCRDVHGFNRVEVLLHMMQNLITQGLDSGVLKIPPPILSRVYQTLSRGFVNLLNAKKIVDTRFPFPYAQTIAALLFIHVFLTPVMLTGLFTSPLWAATFSFMPLFGLWCLNYVAIELENPFGRDDNDLPLEHFQWEMNNCLMMLVEVHSDLLPSLSPTRAITDFEMLQAHVGDQRCDDIAHVVFQQEIDFFTHSLSLDDESPSRRSWKRPAEDAALLPVPKPALPQSASLVTQAGDHPLPAPAPAAPEPTAAPNPPAEQGATTPAPAPAAAVDAASTRIDVPPTSSAGSVEQSVSAPATQPLRLEFLKPADAPAAKAREAFHPPSSPSQCAPPAAAASAAAGASLPQALNAGPSSLCGLQAHKNIDVVTEKEPKWAKDAVGVQATSSMEDFQEALRRWTIVVEGQLGELQWNLAALKTFRGAVMPVLDPAAVQADGTRTSAEYGSTWARQNYAWPRKVSGRAHRHPEPLNAVPGPVAPSCPPILSEKSIKEPSKERDAQRAASEFDLPLLLR